MLVAFDEFNRFEKHRRILVCETSKSCLLVKVLIDEMVLTGVLKFLKLFVAFFFEELLVIVL